MSARLRGRLPWLAGGLIALLGLVLVAGLAVAAMRRPLDNGRVYTVGQVQAQLAHTPEAWVGRSVRVRGMVLSSGCLSWDPGGGGVQCRDRTTYLLDRDGASLPIAGWQRDPLLAFLQRLPLAGRLVPRALVVRWGEVATYRVRLLVAPAAACGAAPCHEALLLDAAPDALGAGQGDGSLAAAPVGLLGLLVAGGLAVVALDRPPDHGPVQSVLQVQAQLAHHPGAWVGRTVRVRGRAVSCYLMPAPVGRCAPEEPRLTDPDGGATSEPLLLAWADPNPALAFLLRLPRIGRLGPASQQIRWGALATYRVRLRAAPTAVCGTPRCYEAVLLDAAPQVKVVSSARERCAPTWRSSDKGAYLSERS